MSLLALSTCWCSHRHRDGYEMLDEIRELGFRRAELSHGISLLLVPGILRACKEGWITVSSVHNFCPLPSGVRRAAPNLFEPSARRSAERGLWRRYSLQTLEFASQVGASKVVMHSGSAKASWLRPSPKEALEVLPPESGAASKKRARALDRLRGMARTPMDRVLKGYLDLIPKARALGLQLGLENREGILELPLDADWPAFLQALEGDDGDGDGLVRYWHDTGHAQIKERLGLADHRALLESMADRITGFHLHDVSPDGRDHQALGNGQVDFAMIHEFVRPHHDLVLELSPTLVREQVIESRDYLLEAWG